MHIKENFLQAYLIFCEFVSVLKINILFSIPSRKSSYTPYCRKFSARLQNFLGVSVNGCQFSENDLYISIPKLKGNGLEIADCIKGFWKFLKIFTKLEELKMIQTNIPHIQGIPLKSRGKKLISLIHL